MKAALFTVTAIGIVVGLAVPPVRHAPAVATAQPSSAGSRGASPVDVAPPDASAPSPTQTVLQRRDNGHFVAIANVNAQPVHFIVDTGADMVALTEEDARRANVVFDPAQFVVVGRGAGGDVRGQEVRIAAIELDGKRVEDVRGVVLDGAEISLLGQSFLRQLSDVHIQKDTMILQ